MIHLACLVLAAGEGARFGGRKQLALYQGKPLLRHVLEELTPLFGRDLYIVLGAYRDEIAPHAAPIAQVIEHQGWRHGLGSSIATGVKSLAQTADYDGVMLVLGDQIRIKRDAFSNMIEHFDGKHIVTSVYAGKKSVPAIFPASSFAELKCLTGDYGARKLLRSNDTNLISVPLPEAEIDIDTQADLNQLQHQIFNHN